MKVIQPTGCACCTVNRRHFLASCGTCAAGLAGLSVLRPKPLLAAKSARKPRVRVVFSHIPAA